jgi:hypothetical protein
MTFLNGVTVTDNFVGPIAVRELKRLLRAAEPPTVLDARDAHMGFDWCIEHQALTAAGKVIRK